MAIPRTFDPTRARAGKRADREVANADRLRSGPCRRNRSSGANSRRIPVLSYRSTRMPAPSLCLQSMSRRSVIDAKIDAPARGARALCGRESSGSYRSRSAHARRTIYRLARPAVIDREQRPVMKAPAEAGAWGSSSGTCTAYCAADRSGDNPWTARADSWQSSRSSTTQGRMNDRTGIVRIVTPACFDLSRWTCPRERCMSFSKPWVPLASALTRRECRAPR